MIGRLIAGRYGVYRRIAHGGMGAVYEARQAAMDRTVALKVLSPRLTSNDAAARWFANEAVAASRLRHPNTITLYDFGRTDDNLLYIAMEYLDGISLDALLRRERIDPARACRIARQVAASLTEAHAAGVVHRDIKPANVLICTMANDENFVKVLDFGIAALHAAPADGRAMPPKNTAVGTPLFMSPEQIQKRPMDGRSDLYSLGVLLYESLSGEVPFKERDSLALLIQHLDEPAPPVPDPAPPAPPIPDALKALVAQLLAKHPENRIQTATAVVAALTEIEDELASSGGA